MESIKIHFVLIYLSLFICIFSFIYRFYWYLILLLLLSKTRISHHPVDDNYYFFHWSNVNLRWVWNVEGLYFSIINQNFLEKLLKYSRIDTEYAEKCAENAWILLTINVVEWGKWANGLVLGICNHVRARALAFDRHKWHILHIKNYTFIAYSIRPFHLKIKEYSLVD